MKRNPLFIDSTKFQGDNIITIVELDGVPTENGDSLFIKIKQEGGEDQVFHLTPGEDTQWKCQLNLPHMKEIKYYFFIIRDNKIIDQTPHKTSISSYFIHEMWTSQKESSQTKEITSFDRALSQFHERLTRLAR